VAGVRLLARRDRLVDPAGPEDRRPGGRGGAAAPASRPQPPDRERRGADDDQAGQPDPLAVLPPRRPGRRADPDEGRRPGDRAQEAPAEEPPVAHAHGAGDDRDQRVDHGDEAGRGHRAAAAAGQERLGVRPGVLAEPPAEAAGPDPVAVAAAEQVADRLAEQGPERAHRDQRGEPGGAGDGGAGQQHHAVPRQQQPDQQRGLQRHERAGQQVQHGGLQAAERVKQGVDRVGHAPTLPRSRRGGHRGTALPRP
jgi:hypothetical protein